MPEGPEVRRFADSLNQALSGKPIVSLLARTKTAKTWEKEHPGVLLNKRIERVLSHGKHLVGLIEGNYYFHSHLMMWGSWAVLDNPPQEIDRRERSRIVVPDACAILFQCKNCVGNQCAGLVEKCGLVTWRRKLRSRT